MSHDEFTKLFKYMEEKFSVIDQRFDTVDTRFLRVESNLAELSARLKDYQVEVLATGHQLDRVERWTHEIANHTGTTLSPA